MLDGLKNTRIVFDQPNILGSKGGSKKSPANVKGGLCLSGAFNFYRFSLCAFFIFLSFAFFSTAHAVKDFTWPTIKWPGAVPPVFTTSNGAEDITSFFYNGSSYYGVASYDFR